MTRQTSWSARQKQMSFVRRDVASVMQCEEHGIHPTHWASFESGSRLMDDDRAIGGKYDPKRVTPKRTSAQGKA